ncbi:MAG: hypothetical protein GSR85_11920 [Desulfurococcales archaeon]|nr:hypothetical protein [Desulfurococcales archaeon]
MGKPLYENVGIGTIIKHIGECSVLMGDYDLSVLLTQQTPKEEECRDLCITVGSKLVIIDFKAPDIITTQERIYRNVKTRIKGLKGLLGSSNLLLGLLHATLEDSPGKRNSGYFLHVAAPMTTIFTPLFQFTDLAKVNSTNNIMNIGDIKVRNIKYPFWYHLEDIGCNNIWRLCQPCYELYPITWRPYLEFTYLFQCLSCHSLYSIRILVTVNNNNRFIAEGYTLSSLLWMIKKCNIGYKVQSDEDRTKIVEAFLGPSGKIDREDMRTSVEHIYLLVYTPGLGFQVIPLNIF